MNIVMLTNTFIPHVGGVARSVQAFTGELRRRGHRILVIAPAFEGTPENEDGVLRMPAWRHFSGGDFSVPAPVPGRVSRALDRFGPQIVHAHHPFLLGETALRVGASRNLPVVFTHHTLYEHYTHYLRGKSHRWQRFASELATGFANLCDGVIAPSASVAALIRERGVNAPVEVIPTGVDNASFAPGDGSGLRRKLGIPPQAFVVGHVGRLAPEKEPLFLAGAVARFLSISSGSHFLLAGTGPSAEAMEDIFAAQGLCGRLHRLQVVSGAELTDAYRAMDVFAFASGSETQGMVLTEAMATGVPVVAVDGPGVREVVRDGVNGRLLARRDPEGFAEALAWMAGRDREEAKSLRSGALNTARDFSLESTTGKLLDFYGRVKARHPGEKDIEGSRWASTRRRFQEELRILHNITRAAEDALLARKEVD